MSKVDYQTLKVVELKELVKQRGIKVSAIARKAEIVQALTEADAKAARQPAKAPQKEQPPPPRAQENGRGRASKPPENTAPRRRESAPQRDMPAKATSAAQEPQPAPKREAPPAREPQPAPKREAQPTPRRGTPTARETQPAPRREAPIAREAQPAPKREAPPARTPRPQSGFARNDAKPPTETKKPFRKQYPEYRPIENRGNRADTPPTRQEPVRRERIETDRFEPLHLEPQRAEIPPLPVEANRPEPPMMGVGETSSSEPRESTECSGILDIHTDGYGFLRVNNYLPGPGDIYVSNTMIRRFNLRSGDYITGKTFIEKRNERNSALVFVSQVNELPIDRVFGRRRFEDLVPVYPDERITLESPKGNSDLAIRLIDILAPIGFGQRGMIVSPPKAGKTTLLKKIANAVSGNHPEAHLMVLLIDERPEEVTDMQRSVDGEVLASTFDQQPEHHARLAEMALDRAQRLVECGKDVVVLLDSITRLSRAYNLIIPSTGRSLSGGLDPGALYKPKRFFGAARNIENGGSLTIIASALVDTGSRMDDIIFEEFKGTGNMEIVLDRKLSERRIFPAIDMAKSGTRREDLLLNAEEMAGVMAMRRVLQGNSSGDSTDQLISMMMKSANNREFFARLKGWETIWQKDGYVMQNR